MNSFLLEELEKRKIITLGRGKIISKDEINATPGNYPVYSSSAQGDGIFGKYGCYMFNDERITWSIDGGGKLFYRKPHKYSVTNVCGWMKVNKSDVLNTKYLYYCLIAQWRKMVFDYTYKAHPSVIRKIYRIPIIPIKEQNKIVLILSQIESALKPLNTKIKLLDELIKSRFVELFMNKNYPLKSMDEISLGKGEYGAGSASIDYDSSRPRYVRITDINDDGTLNDDFVSSINIEDDNTYKLEYGDFLFARMGATVGKTYAFKEGNQIFAGYLIRYKLNPEIILPEFLYSYTTTEAYKNWVKLNQSGAAQPGINAKKYGSLQIPVPPIKLQKEFRDLVNQLDKSKFICQQRIKLYQELLDKKMDEYFNPKEEN